MFQWFLNFLLGRPRGLLEKLLRWTRRGFLKVSNPIVRYHYGGHDFFLPFAHDFPFYIKDHPLYAHNLGRLAGLVSKKYPEGNIIDVGANIGDSIVVLRKHTTAPIIAVEGNARFLPLLEKNIRPYADISIAPVFVGERDGRAELSDYSGSSAFLRSSDQGVSVLSIVFFLELYPAAREVKLIKIDCDGFDNAIIRACEPLLRQAKPVLFFEYDPFFLAKQGESGLDIFPFLAAHGYDRLALFDNIGRPVCGLSIADDQAIIAGLHEYFNQGSERFLDICAFSVADEELCEQLLSSYR